jgi:hypothetical protein
MTQRKAKYYPRRNNAYVPRMDYAADIILDGPHEVRFGPMAVQNATSILNAQAMGSGGTATLGGTIPLLQDNTDPVVPGVSQQGFPYGPGFGRNLRYVASAASTVVVSVAGRDYLGQPMTEAITLNGATPVVGKKAFKYIDNISWPAAGVTLTVGTGAAFGLPYRMMNVLTESADGVATTLGTLVTPDLTDPATNLTGDTRGTYTPTTVPDGIKQISAVFIPNRTINAAGNGGLHGIAHA